MRVEPGGGEGPHASPVKQGIWEVPSTVLPKKDNPIAHGFLLT